MSKNKLIHWIEYEKGQHYLAIGRRAPWDRRLQIRVPKWIAVKLNQVV